MSRIAERGIKLTQFHTTALLPDPGRSADGRNPTSVGMATVEEFTDGFPTAAAGFPDDAALLSEVLLERVQHLLRGQVAPDSAGGVQSGRD